MVVNAGTGQSAKDSFGRLMREARQRDRLTQQEVADRLGVTAMTVSRWETKRGGIVQPRLRPAVASFLSISERELLHLLDLPVPSNKVVAIYGGGSSTQSLPSRLAAVPSEDRRGPTTKTVLGAIAQRIATGVQLSDEEIRYHERLLAEARLTDAADV